MTFYVATLYGILNNALYQKNIYKIIPELILFIRLGG